MELINLFEEKESIKFTPKDLKIRNESEDIKGENKQNEKVEDVKKDRFVFKGPFILRMKILKEGNYRLEGQLYHLMPGDYFEGANLTTKKREILINTKHIIME